MKKLIISLLVIAAFVVAPTSLFAQNSATTTGSATVIVPIAVTAPVDLDFGYIAHTAGGTVQILAQAGAQTPTVTETVSLLPQSTPTAANFHVTGTAGTTYTFTCPTTLSLKDAGEAHSMNVTLTHNKGDFSGNDASAIPSDKTFDDIYVGGTLTVENAQVAGAYTGNLQVTVAYN